MKHILLFIILIGCNSFNVMAQLNLQDYFNNPEWYESRSEMEDAQILSFAEKKVPVHYFHDVVYSKSHERDLTLQILEPTAKKLEKYPCIIYIQGSAWMKQDVYANLPALARFSERGYVIAIVEYTHSGIAPFPAPLQDVKTAIRFMRKNADMYGVDVDNMFVWGDSSGGHLALMTTLTDGIPEFETRQYDGFSTKVNACVSFYGISDIKSVHTDPRSASSGKGDSPEGMLLGGKDVSVHSQEADIASPIHYVSDNRQISPIMLAVGTNDHIVPFSQTELMAKTLKETGKEYEYYVLKGADHGSWEFWTPQFFDVVDSFLKKHMRYSSNQQVTYNQ